MPVTLRELADKAGVSVATVSFALNNDSRIKPETRQRIHKLAAEMGYIPDVWVGRSRPGPPKSSE